MKHILYKHDYSHIYLFSFFVDNYVTVSTTLLTVFLGKKLYVTSITS